MNRMDTMPHACALDDRRCSSRSGGRVGRVQLYLLDTTRGEWPWDRELSRACTGRSRTRIQQEIILASAGARAPALGLDRASSSERGHAAFVVLQRIAS